MTPFTESLLVEYLMQKFLSMRRSLAQISGAALCLMGVLCTTPAYTQEITPETIAARYTAATRSGDWASVAQLMHPEALTQFQKMFAPLVAADPQKVGTSFFGVSSQKEYDQLPKAEVFKRFMNAMSKQIPGMAIALDTSEVKIIGHVREEPDLAHIVYQMNTQLGDIKVSKTSVMTLKKEGQSWRALLSGNIEGLAAALARPKLSPDELLPQPPK